MEPGVLPTNKWSPLRRGFASVGNVYICLSAEEVVQFISVVVSLSKYYLSLLTAAWIWGTCDTLSLSLTLYSSFFLSNTQKQVVSLSTVVLTCFGWLGLCEVIQNPSQSPCWGESGRHGRSWDMGQIPTFVVKLIKSIWVWGMSIMECRSITSKMFCMSWGEAVSGSWCLHAHGIQLRCRSLWP